MWLRSHHPDEGLRAQAMLAVPARAVSFQPTWTEPEIRPVACSTSARVALLCTGLGHVNRGYESFAAGAFRNLSSDVDLCLLKGGGRSERKEFRLFTAKRDGH